jgi:hypothetical protein
MGRLSCPCGFLKKSDMLLPFGIFKRPTEGEGRVIFWMVFLVLVGIGAACVYLGCRAPAEKAKEAAGAIYGGCAFIAAGVVMLVIRRFFSGY